MIEDTSLQGKLAYHSPVLEVYGTMAELTAAAPGAPPTPDDGAPGGYAAGVS